MLKALYDTNNTVNLDTKVRLLDFCTLLEEKGEILSCLRRLLTSPISVENDQRLHVNC